MNKIPAALGFGRGVNFQAVVAGPELASTGEVPPSIFRQILRVALRWRRYIIGSVAACLILGLIVTFLMTPMYRAATTLEIARESNKIVNIQGGGTRSERRGPGVLPDPIRPLEIARACGASGSTDGDR
jgi:hypothetical protein